MCEKMSRTRMEATASGVHPMRGHGTSHRSGTGANVLDAGVKRPHSRVNAGMKFPALDHERSTRGVAVRLKDKNYGKPKLVYTSGTFSPDQPEIHSRMARAASRLPRPARLHTCISGHRRPRLTMSGWRQCSWSRTRRCRDN